MVYQSYKLNIAINKSAKLYYYLFHEVRYVSVRKLTSKVGRPKAPPDLMTRNILVINSAKQETRRKRTDHPFQSLPFSHAPKSEFLIVIDAWVSQQRIAIRASK
jgi:hypothetical protein